MGVNACQTDKPINHYWQGMILTQGGEKDSMQIYSIFYEQPFRLWYTKGLGE